MASLYKRSRSPFWWIKYRDAAGRIIRESTKLRVGVGRDTRLARKLHAAKISETYLNPMPGVELGEQPIIRFVQKGGRHTVKPLHPKLVQVFEKLQGSGATETYPYPKSQSKTWHAFLKRIGIKRASPNACFHSFRVTAASRLAQNNIPMRKAMKYLSHASTTVHNAYVR